MPTSLNKELAMNTQELNVKPLLIPAIQKPTRTLRYSGMITGSNIEAKIEDFSFSNDEELKGVYFDVLSVFCGGIFTDLDFDTDKFVDYFKDCFMEKAFLDTIVFSSKLSKYADRHLKVSYKEGVEEGDVKLAFILAQDSTDKEEIEKEHQKKVNALVSEYQTALLAESGITEQQLNFVVKASGKTNLEGFKGQAGHKLLTDLIKEFIELQ